MKIAQFTAKNGVTMSVEQTDKNPYMPNAGYHFRCVLRSTNQPRRSLMVIFSLGLAHHGKTPTVGEVLDCLASDASGIENAKDFADWAAEYGYDLADEDKRREARKVYTATKKNAEGLERILGDAAYNKLLWETERE